MFGITTLMQGNGGPTNSNSVGNSDTVKVWQRPASRT